MHQFRPIPGAAAEHFVLSWRNAPEHVVKVRHKTEGEYTLIFETEADARAYQAEDIPTPIKTEYVPKPFGEMSKTPTDKYMLVTVGEPEGEPALFLSCPICDNNGFETAFESLPDEMIKCKECGTKLHASEFHPRLIQRTSAPRAERPADDTLKLRTTGGRANVWARKAKKPGDAGELFTLTDNHGFSQLVVTGAPGWSWPAAFNSPFDARIFVDNLTSAAKLAGVKTKPAEGHRPVEIRKCGLLDESAYVIEITRAVETCPRCGRLMTEYDVERGAFACDACGG